MAPCTIVGVKWATMHFIQDDCPIHLNVIQVLNELGKDSQNRLCTFFSQEVAFLEFEIVTTAFIKQKK